MKVIYFFTATLLLASACVERGSNNKDAEENYNSSGNDEHKTNAAADIIDNSEIEENSFSTSPYFAEWDTNGDKKVDENEFNNHYFTMLDENSDGKLGKEEWKRAVQSFFGGEGEINYGELSEWDTDSNGQVSKEEFTAYLKDKDIFSDWASGSEPLKEEQFAKGVFRNWDTDGNGVVESEEYTEEYNRTDEGI